MNAIQATVVVAALGFATGILRTSAAEFGGPLSVRIGVAGIPIVVGLVIILILESVTVPAIRGTREFRTRDSLPF